VSGDADPAAAAFEYAASVGVRCLPVPTPFAVGRINAYLLEDEPLTLIDSGPNSAHAFDRLERSLQQLGHEIADLELLVITHQHSDHLGLADVIARRSGAEVAAFGPLGAYLDRFHDEMELDDRFAAGIMVRHGVSEELVTALRAVTAIARAWGSRVHVTRPLAHGDVIELAGRTLEVFHSPGHSPSDLVLWDAGHEIAFAGDHLLDRISSNPVITRPLGAGSSTDGERPRALMSYIASMRQTASLPARVVFGGHGGPVVGHQQLVAERIAMHERRATKIHGILTEDGPLSAHEIALKMWGKVAVTQAYLTLSEVLGHMDLLLEDGRAEELAEPALIRFRALPAPAAAGRA
jgi:glyoxylase-like metal-dependent hydrolase (beta-lactamase superfamily II)